MLGLVFTLVMLAYGLLMLRRKAGGELARLLWALYFGLGLSASLIDATGILLPVFEPNYEALALLLFCVLASISGFLSFRARDLQGLITEAPNISWLEWLLVGGQLYALTFFAPFAIASLSGDPNEGRLDLESKMEAMGSYGLFNTFAGFAAQLFTVSLVLAFLRLARADGRTKGNSQMALALVVSSLSYVVYVLAYVGRDGFVFWLMSALAMFFVFRQHLPRPVRSQIVTGGLILTAAMAFPFAAITIARFANWEAGASGSLFEYFGQQINHFSDFASIDRPMTFGLMNFPMFAKAGCATAGIQCEVWDQIKPFIFEQYLNQGKEPWLFATFVSDFIGDFGTAGATALVLLLAVLGHRVGRARSGAPMTLSRLLLLVLLFLVPYWGVFYFRFGIGNSAILLNLVLVLTTWVWARSQARRAPAAQPDTPRLARAADVPAHPLPRHPVT